MELEVPMKPYQMGEKGLGVVLPDENKEGDVPLSLVMVTKS